MANITHKRHANPQIRDSVSIFQCIAARSAKPKHKPFTTPKATYCNWGHLLGHLVRCSLKRVGQIGSQVKTLSSTKFNVSHHGVCTTTLSLQIQSAVGFSMNNFLISYKLSQLSSHSCCCLSRVPCIKNKMHACRNFRPNLNNDVGVSSSQDCSGAPNQC